MSTQDEEKVGNGEVISQEPQPEVMHGSGAIEQGKNEVTGSEADMALPPTTPQAEENPGPEV